MTEPHILETDEDRRMARRMRDWQWSFMDRVNREGTVWVCWWNKNRRHDERSNLPDDLLVLSLMTGAELAGWLNSHADWWEIGEWSDERYAAPVSLTDAGRAAIVNRHRYDMEFVEVGLVEPGWKALPTEGAAS
jgi:hypothetical protein